MKFNTKDSHIGGHIIVLTLMASLVLGVVLAGVISPSSSEGPLTGRSESWNAAMPVVEAGIEEALTQLRYCPTNRSRNGWTFANNLYTKRRFIGDGFYEVTITTNRDPIIISRAVVKAPGQTNYSIYRAVQVFAT